MPNNMISDILKHYFPNILSNAIPTVGVVTQPPISKGGKKVRLDF